jgi:hypothetical protein
VVDERSGSTYFWNVTTNAVQWDVPADLAAAGYVESPLSSADEDHEDEAEAGEEDFNKEQQQLQQHRQLQPFEQDGLKHEQLDADIAVAADQEEDDYYDSDGEVKEQHRQHAQQQPELQLHLQPQPQPQLQPDDGGDDDDNRDDGSYDRRNADHRGGYGHDRHDGGGSGDDDNGDEDERWRRRRRADEQEVAGVDETAFTRPSCKSGRGDGDSEVVGGADGADGDTTSEDAALLATAAATIQAMARGRRIRQW